MIKVSFTKTHEDAITPTNAYGDDAGWDLYTLNNTAIGPYGITDVRTGIAIALPTGYYARIVARSSTTRKGGIGIVEGIIDAGFRGELFAGAYLLRHMMLDAAQQPYEAQDIITPGGFSICQLIVQEVKPVRFVEVSELPISVRGERGFGSSG